MKFIIFGIFALLWQGSANAASPTFTNITEGDYDQIVKELSANFAYTTVTPASTLGKIWGLEFGIVAGYTKCPDILNLVKRADPNTSLKDKFPHASLIGRIGLPYAFTVESAFIPAKTISDVTFQEFGGAVMWTPTDMFLDDLPFTLAAKTFYTRTKISYGQRLTDSVTGGTVNATIEFKDRLMGIQSIISRKFLVFEPYLGVGYITAKGDLSVNASGSVTIFNSTFSAASGRSASSKPSSGQLFAGLDIKLLFLSLGAEAAKSYGTTSYTGRLSFRF